MKPEDFFVKQAEAITNYLKEQTTDAAAQAKLARELFDTVAQQLQAEAPATDYLSAPNAVVEITDTKTGNLYRRYLELEYQENDNGIRLLGEDMSGQQAQIVFLSSTALHKMHDLRGKGPDEPHHKHD